ncbi:NAD(P)/FAD-dependent oxidoreductase [Jiangella alkaliphila]|uniref:Geranylgeranyl reductase family n=1 Tax=Jiangella alkaliphila TaxID=419479 RepID=A0A1H2LD53_9ACTN|nr:geranylgeranyl reductase family protein [Jiangella alkaliphila]SDU78356.1 geranylgeranyl reductase family [Jiangella alkaliphila]
MDDPWDLVIVGAGPAGAAAALGALTAAPELRVLLLDRAAFPRDKACGDGVAPDVTDMLAALGVPGLLDDWAPVQRLELSHGSRRVSRPMRRPVRVVPRTVLDHRLQAAAVAAGARFERRRVRTVQPLRRGVIVDDDLTGLVVIGADGAYSAVRQAAGVPAVRRRAIALRGYVATPPRWSGRQVIAFDHEHPQAYAWCFDRGDGLANVGYGAFGTAGLTRAALLRRLGELLPGADDGTDWRGHHLPLSSWRWSQPDGHLLLAGDAAGLINPMTGEGLHYAVATGALAGRAAAAAITAGRPDTAGARHRSAVRALLGRHLRHTATAARLSAVPAVLTAGIAAANRDQGVFDELVELGLGQGRLTRRVVTGLARALVVR